MAVPFIARYDRLTMALDPETEARLLAKLVRRGILDEAATRTLFADAAKLQAEGRSVSLAAAAIRRGLIEKDRFIQYVRTDGEDAPELTGFSYVEKIGEGGTAHVYRVKRGDGVTLAAKVLKPEIAANPAEVTAFLAEAKLLRSLEHENVVRGVKSGRIDGWYVSLMEDIPGETLLEKIQGDGAVPEDDALFMILQAARALEYLRSQGVVHRDIKPGNIMVTPDNVVKVIDLGFAATGETEVDESEGTARGTAAYLSPEQARGQADLDVRSDIYSLGATLYQLVLGELPFEGDDEELVRKAVLDGLSAEATKDGRISQYTHYFIEKMMAKDRDHRYQDPAALIEDIESKVEGRDSMAADAADGGDDEAAERARKRVERMRRKRQRRK